MIVLIFLCPSEVRRNGTISSLVFLLINKGLVWYNYNTHNMEIYNMNEIRRLVLASGSPRRKEILTRLGYAFTIHTSDADEGGAHGHVSDMVKTLAERKGAAVVPYEKDAIVISCDTLVSLDDVPLGKPADKEDALRMLASLSGRSHEVWSGICLTDTKTGRKLTDSVCTKVYFRDVSREELASYVETGEPMDKAGAYAIQGGAGKFVEKFEGPYDNIVGFPSERFEELLKEILG